VVPTPRGNNRRATASAPALSDVGASLELGPAGNDAPGLSGARA